MIELQTAKTVIYDFFEKDKINHENKIVRELVASFLEDGCTIDIDYHTLFNKVIKSSMGLQDFFYMLDMLIKLKEEIMKNYPSLVEKSKE